VGLVSDADRNDVLAELRELGRHVGHPESLEMPPAGLWDRIAAEAGVPSTAGETTPGPPDATDATDATVTELPRRVPRSVWILSAAAAVVVIAVIGAAVFRGANEASLVASATLDRLQGESAEGTAELRDLDGAMQLQLQASGLDAGDGFLEVWMIDPDVTQLVSLGPLRPDGTYDLPNGMDAAAFPIVDVSFESFDGDPTHSGDSVLRGQLEF
jgi:anti-sigma-K factor RskA